MSELNFYDGLHTGQEIDNAVSKALSPDASPNASHTGYLISSAAVANAVASIQQTVAKILSNPAGQNVSAGEYVIYNNALYRANSAISSSEAASSFTSKLTSISGGGLNELQSIIDRAATYQSFSMSSSSKYALVFSSYDFAARVFSRNAVDTLDAIFSNGRLANGGIGTLTATLDNTSGSPTRYRLIEINNSGASCYLGVISPPGVIESFTRIGAST